MLFNIQSGCGNSPFFAGLIDFSRIQRKTMRERARQQKAPARCAKTWRVGATFLTISGGYFTRLKNFIYSAPVLRIKVLVLSMVSR